MRRARPLGGRGGVSCPRPAPRSAGAGPGRGSPGRDPGAGEGKEPETEPPPRAQAAGAPTARAPLRPVPQLQAAPRPVLAAASRASGALGPRLRRGRGRSGTEIRNKTPEQQGEVKKRALLYCSAGHAGDRSTYRVHLASLTVQVKYTPVIHSH